MRNQLKWRSMNHCTNVDEGKSGMTDTNGLQRVAEEPRKVWIGVCTHGMYGVCSTIEACRLNYPSCTPTLFQQVDMEWQLAREVSQINRRIDAELKYDRKLAAKDAWIKELETSNPSWELLISTQNEVVKWKKEVIAWQDTDTENQEAIEAKDAEIKRLSEENERLKKGFEDMTSMLLGGKND